MMAAPLTSQDFKRDLLTLVREARWLPALASVDWAA
jgi:hypothetical protein